MPKKPLRTPQPRHPTLVVHGLWDSVRRIAPLVDGLRARGIKDVHAIGLTPASGRAPLEVLASQVERFVLELVDDMRGDDRNLSIVGFSMGALISRYYLQHLAGDRHVDRFISISGPHHGTLTAFAGFWPGIKQMRPHSSFLQQLDPSVARLRTVTHCIYTPFDAMIVPPRSSILEGAATVHAIPALYHRAMLHDPRVLDLTAQLLLEPATTKQPAG